MLRGLPARTLPQRVVRAATRPLRVLRRRWVAGGAILTYHRVAEPGSSPFGLSVSPAHFEAHLAYLSTRCRVMPLLEMARRLACDDLPPRSVAVTFDDGYVDNLRNARPLLERYEVPGTVFVATGYIGG